MKKTSLLFLFLSCTVYAFSQDYNSQELIKKGVALFDKGEFPEAIKTYKQVHAADSNYTYMLSELAMTYLKMESYGLAIKTCEEALIDVSHYENHIMRTLATAYDEKGEPKEAIRIYSKALEKYPYDYLLLYNLAITYYGIKDYPKTVELCQMALKSNPFHTSSHLILAKISAAQGQLSHAFLSLQTFLLLEPNSSRSNKALICLENLSKNYIDTSYVGAKIEPFIANDLFEDLDHYISAKIVLNNRFESAYDFNASLVKQTQLVLEKLPYQNSERDFWSEFYFSFYKNTKNQNFVSEFLNTILRSAKRESINKWSKKNEKSLKKFYQTGSYLGNFKNYRWINDSTRITCKHYDSGSIKSIGNFSTAEKEIGDWTYYFEGGSKQANGSFVEGKKEGAWAYYNLAGYLETTCSYIDGKLTGTYADFDAYGNQRTDISYANGEIQGDVKFLYPCQVIEELNQYSQSEINGPGYALYPTGDTLSTFVYKDSKIVGEYKRFHSNGNLFYHTYYTDGQRDGDYIEYYVDGSISVKGKYKIGKEDGTWDYFYTNGKLKNKMFYEKGKKAGNWVEYDKQGDLLKQYEFNGEGQLNKDYIYYSKGLPHVIESYRKDMLIGVTSLNAIGDTIKYFGAEDGGFEFETYSLDEFRLVKGQFVQGKNNGARTTYWRNGTIREASNYVMGQLDGELLVNHENGLVQIKKQYTKGKENGIYQEYYKDGNLKSKGYYKEGIFDGLWFNYYPNGILEQIYNYKKGDIKGWMYDYSVDGKLAGRTKFEKGSPVEICQFDSLGKMYHSQNLLTSGKRIFMNCNKSVEGEGKMTCGKLNGDLTWYYPDGNDYIVKHFENGNAMGAFVIYHPSGKIKTEGQFLNDSRSGVWKEFYEDGALKKAFLYAEGQLDSTYTNYWQNGNIRTQSIYKNGEKEGDYFYYDPEGNLAIKKIYVDGQILAYQYEKNGKLCDRIYLENGTGKVLAYYNSGKKSVDSAYKLGRFDGKNIHYYQNGKQISEMEYASGNQIGEEVLYHENGKLRSKIAHNHGRMDGESRTYYANGKLKCIKAYKMGTLQGEVKNYDELGKLISIEDYWNGKLTNYKIL